MAARRKKLSGTSAYSDNPCRKKEGVPSSITPASKPWFRPLRTETAENRSATVLKVKAKASAAGTAAVSRPR